MMPVDVFLAFRKRPKYVAVTGLVILSGLVLLVAFRPSIATLSFLAVVASFVTIQRPDVGVSLWIMAMPLEKHIINYIGVSPFIILVPAVLTGIFGYVALGGHLRIKNHMITFALLLGGAFVISSLGSSFLDYNQVRVVISAFLMIVMSSLIAWVIYARHFGMWVIGHAVISAALITLITGLMLGEFTWRLQIADNVRTLANIIGIALTLVIAILISTRPNERRFIPYQNNKIILVFLSIIFVAALAATASRGVIGAVSVTMLITVFVNVIFSKSDSRLQNVWGSIGLVSVISIIGFILVPYVDEVFAGGRLLERIMIALERPGENVRWAIWSSALAEIPQIEWVFGAGPGAFRSLAQSAGYDFYAHSVYIDVFVGAGAVGLGTLIAYILYIFTMIVKRESLIGISFWFFLILGFVTHGSVSTKEFWVVLGIAAGLSLKKDDPTTAD